MTFAVDREKSPMMRNIESEFKNLPCRDVHANIVRSGEECGSPVQGRE